MERYAIRHPQSFDPLLTVAVYAEYAKTSNLLAVLIYAIMLVGAQTAQIGMARFQSTLRIVLLFVCTHNFPA